MERFDDGSVEKEEQKRGQTEAGQGEMREMVRKRGWDRDRRRERWKQRELEPGAGIDREIKRARARARDRESMS